MSIGLLVAILAVIALIGGAWWFVHLNVRGRPAPLKLQVGDALPAFGAETESGGSVNSSDLRGQPAVILFVRGSWCPFCNRQVADLTSHYKEITDRGARLIFVTPKPLDTTRRVAEMFDVKFEFWLDPDLAIARQLDLVHSAGVPGKHQETFGHDTVWPTALVCDAEGIIRYASQSKRIMDRPDPRTLLDCLSELG
ncbi:MAG: AhpC/TSA family protein [Woeseia sp.]|nr:peroxiredoxin family protein [Woeseia sp.]MBT8096411.1 peroxiredoxin family protein [Woeseia sp.]NNE60876.1 AhpC/TSA family protein [Woeseia sp.]NNL55956.1 AhpC/TSA family protein [Woeseia sp.]